MQRKEIIAGLLRTAFDFFAVITAWSLTYWLRPITDLIPGVQTYFPKEALPSLEFYIPFVAVSAGFLLIMFFLLGFYPLVEKFDPIKEFLKIVFGVFLWGMLIVAYFSLVRHEPFFSRVMLFQAMFFSLLLIFVLRIFLRWLFSLAWKNKSYARKVLLIGEGGVFESLKKTLSKTMPFVLKEAIVEHSFNYAKNIASKAKFDEVWYASSNFSFEKMKEAQLIAEKNHLYFRFVPSELGMRFASMEMEIFNGIPVLQPKISALDGWSRVFKRFFDIIFSLFLIVLFSPVFLLIIFAIKLESKGSIFYVSKRVGKKGKKFSMIKFRSMEQNADKKKKDLIKLSHRKDGPLFKIKNDPRITKVGKFLRRFSLDELPQLINVLLGDMSMTGPRPHLPEEIKEFSVAETRVLNIRPGLTGLAQVSGRSNLSFQKEIELDLYFIQNWHILMELKIIFKTIWVVLGGKGAD